MTPDDLMKANLAKLGQKYNELSTV
jgi:hypothetical protein